jgi:hypothetical protein
LLSWLGCFTTPRWTSISATDPEYNPYSAS